MSGSTAPRIGLVMVTAERRIAFANAAWAEVLDLAPTDIVGRHMADVLEDVYEAQVRPRLDSAFAGESVSCELTLPPRREGEAQRHLATTCDPPVATPHGPCVIVTVFDISERLWAEAALAASRERFAGIVASAMDAIVSIDSDQRIVLFNAAAQTMFRCQAVEAIGAPIDRFLPGRFRAAHQAHVQRFGEGGITSRAMGRLGAPLTGLRTDGEEFPLEASISKYDAGGTHLYTAILRDVTERRRAELMARQRDEELRVAAEVAQASKYKSEFLANMSHELRTPLNSLLILSRLLADNRERNLTPRQVEFAETMHQSGSDLLRLINEILDLSRIEAGQVEVVIESVALAALGDRIERSFRHVAQSRHLGFAVDLDAGLPATIDSDPNRLEQVLRNLLSNSFKFTEEGDVRLAIRGATEGWPTPHAGLDAAQGVVAFAVSDTGIGIAPSKQQLIFEAFAQADGTTSRKYGGTGLGLSISREIAALLGGAIGLTSAPGEGSTFTLYLPWHAARDAATTASAIVGPEPEAAAVRAQRHAARQPGLGAMAPVVQGVAVPDRVGAGRARIEPGGGDDVGDPALAGARVLVVDDDIRNVYALFAILENAGIEARHADNGRQCLEILAADRGIDAVLMDIMMPGMDGYETTRRIRELKGQEALPVIALTAKAMKGDREKCLAAGASDYLAKPVDAGQLLSLLRLWLPNRRAGS